MWGAGDELRGGPPMRASLVTHNPSHTRYPERSTALDHRKPETDNQKPNPHQPPTKFVDFRADSLFPWEPIWLHLACKDFPFAFFLEGTRAGSSCRDATSPGSDH